MFRKSMFFHIRFNSSSYGIIHNPNDIWVSNFGHIMNNHTQRRVQPDKCYFTVELLAAILSAVCSVIQQS